MQSGSLLSAMIEHTSRSFESRRFHYEGLRIRIVGNFCFILYCFQSKKWMPEFDTISGTQFEDQWHIQIIHRIINIIVFEFVVSRYTWKLYGLWVEYF